MHFDTATSAMALIRSAKLGEALIAVPDYAHGGGWRIEQKGFVPLTVGQRHRLEALDLPRDRPVASHKTPVRERSAKPAPIIPAKASSERTPRTAGATSVCRAIMTPALAKDKDAFIVACKAQGVIEATATTQWYRLRKDF